MNTYSLNTMIEKAIRHELSNQIDKATWGDAENRAWDATEATTWDKVSNTIRPWTVDGMGDAWATAGADFDRALGMP